MDGIEYKVTKQI